MCSRAARSGSQGLKGDMMKSIMRAIVLGGVSIASTQAFADDDRDVASHLDRPLERLLFDYNATALAQLDDADAWRIDATAWLWTMGLEGDIGAFGLTKSMDASFLDILEASDSVVGLSGRLEIGKGKIAGFVEGLYTKLGVEDVPVGPTDIDLDANIDFEIDLGSGPFNPNPNPNPNPDLDLGLLPGEVDVTLELLLVDFGLMYRLGEWAMNDSTDDPGAKHLTLDSYAGARSTRVSIEIDPEAREVDRDRDWIDPIVGLKSEIPVGDHWQLSVWGDVGGFGAASELTWSATGVVGFDFRMFDLPATIYGGYRAIGYDFSEGSGGDEFVWEVTLHGPLLGFRIVF